ncbi:MAG: hypothetical protein JW388_0958 [Nitrospira sp.]|nr:hypothetical protein [Nitrospira sp.]
MSTPSLAVPSLPADFESRAGSSKTELARAILELLAGANIINYPTSAEDQFDLANFQQRLEDLEQNFEDAVKPIRRVRINGIATAETTTTFTFEDVGDTNFGVCVTIIDETTADIGASGRWFVQSATRTSTSVQVTTIGYAGTFDLEVLIIPYTI